LQPVRQNVANNPIQIPFSLDPSISIWTPEFNLPHRLKFWLAVIRPWLRERGYEMYEIDYDDTRLEWSASWPSDFRSEPEESSPYAYYDRVPDPAQLLEIQSRAPPYAADVSVSGGRHTLISLSPDGAYIGTRRLRAGRTASPCCHQTRWF
jgi:hypothetical protein